MKNHLPQNSLFLGIIFFLFPIAHFKMAVFGIPLYLSEIPLIIATGIIFWKTGKEKQNWTETLQQNKIFLLGATFFLLGATLSYVLNPHTLMGLGMLKSFFFFPLLLMFLLGFTVKSRYESERILWLWVAGLTLVAWISLVFPMMTFDHRLVSLYESPNYLAMLLAPGVLLSVYFFFTTERPLLKLGNIFFGTVLGITLLLTHSYGAILSLVISGTVFFCLCYGASFFSLKRLGLTLGLLLIALFSMLSATEKFQTLLRGDPRSSLVSREMIWTAAMKIGGDHPLWGIGPGNFQKEYLLYQKYFPPYLEWAVPQPHNLYLAFWLQAGLMGLVGFFFLLFFLLRDWVKLYKKTLSTEERVLGTLLLALLLFYLTYGLIDTPYFKNDLALAFWGTAGLLLAWIRRNQSLMR